MIGTIDASVRAAIEGQRLCYTPTVTPDGRLDLSPKGRLRVWDASHLRGG